MRLLSVFLLCAVSAFANYASQVAILLDVGARNVTIVNSGPGGSNLPLQFSPAAGQRVRFTVSPIYVPPPADTVYSACADPCTVSINRTWGQQYYWVEYVDTSGNSLNPVKRSQAANSNITNTCGGLGTLPQVEAPPITTAPLPMPIEVIGQDCYVTRVQLPLSAGHAFTNLRLYLRIHSPGYNSAVRPDGKIDIQLNSGAWLHLTNADATGIDEMRFYSNIGGYPQVREFTLPIPDGTISSTDTIVTAGFRFNGTEGVGSGSRILTFNIIEANKTLSSLSVASNITTASSTAHGFSSGDDVLIQNAPGMYMRFNGLRHITGTTVNNFTFLPCGTSTAGCTSPNATGVAPPVNRETTGWPGNAQAVMYAARAIISKALFTETDPTTWTAPSGANASRGENLFKFGNGTGTVGTDRLVNPNLAYFDNTLHFATCGGTRGCHPSNGSDLKLFNYSNRSIEQRTIFHGFSDQDALDIAAYIRGISAAVPAKGRPWNPPMQPGPGQSTATPEEFFAGCGVDCTLTYGYDDFLEYLPAQSNWVWDRRIEHRDLPLPWQLGGWNQWIPVIHPADGFPNASTPFLSHASYFRYRDIVDNMAPNDFTAFQLKNYGRMYGNGTGFFDFAFSQADPFSVASGQHPPGNWSTRWYSIQQFALKAMWEVAIEKQTFQFDGERIASERGTSATPDPYWPISNGVADFTVFQSGIHKIHLDPIGFMDGTQSIFDYQSNIWYVAQVVLGAANGWGVVQGPIDNAYLNNFIKVLQAYRPTGYTGLLYAQLFTSQAGNLQPTFYEFSGSDGTDWQSLWSDALTLHIRFDYYWYTPAQWTAFINSYLDLVNVLTAAHDVTYWDTIFNHMNAFHEPNWIGANCCKASDALLGQTGRVGAVSAYYLTLFKLWGADNTKLTTYLNWVKSIPSWSSHNFDDDIAAATDGLAPAGVPNNGPCNQGSPNYIGVQPYWFACSNMVP